MSAIRVLVKRVGQDATVEMMENDLASMQAIVDGLVEVVYIDDPAAILWCNEDGMATKPAHLEHRMPSTIHGDVFFTGPDDEHGDCTGLDDETIAALRLIVARADISREVKA